MAPKYQWVGTDHAGNATDVVGHGGETEKNTSLGFYVPSVTVNITG